MIARDGEDRTDAGGHRVGGCARGIRYRETEAAQVVVLVIVAVPAPVILLYMNHQRGGGKGLLG